MPRARRHEDMNLNVHAETETGMVRDHNEDSILKLGGEQSPPGVDALLVVADGMGGHAAGEVASSLAIEQIEQRFTSGEFASTADNDFEEALRSLLQDVNEVVNAAGQDNDKRGMGTTCTLVVIKGSHLYFAHVGDSRAYLFRDETFAQITDDHSWVEEMVRAGSLTKEEARTHPNRNVITRAIGLDSSVQVDTGRRSLKEDDLIMLCSDGLNSMISDEEIHTVIRKSAFANLCTDLIAAANEAGGHDNTSVAVAYLGSEWTSDDTGQDSSTRETLAINTRRPFPKRIWKFISTRT